MDKLDSITSKQKKYRPNKKFDEINFPESNESELIIRCRPNLYGFQIIRSNEDLLTDISNNEINETLFKINKMVDLFLIKKKLDENKEFSIPHNILFKILLGSIIFLSMLTYILVVNEIKQFNEGYVLIPVILILLFVLASFLIVLKGISKVQKSTNYRKLITNKLDWILKKENELHYNSKGYLMERNSSLHWLSLRKVF